MTKLSPRHIQSVYEMRGAQGAAWLERLPALVDACARHWSLRLDAAYPGVWYNYVAPGVDANGAPIVLKVCYPDNEFFTEAEALRLLDGHGINRLLAVDFERSALLIERLVPGTSLHEVRDDNEATAIAARVMRALWRSPPAPPHPFPTYDLWVQHMAERAPHFVPGTAFPADRIGGALALHRELNAAPAPHVLLHGDLHHGNILRATREPWLAIDPKGVIGEPACEAGPLLTNALPEPLDLDSARRVLAPRTRRLAAEIGVEHARLLAWGQVHCVLSAFWSLEDHGRGWEHALLCALALAAL